MQLAPSKLRKILLALVSIALIYGLMAIALKAIGLETAQLWVKQAGIFAPVLFVGLCAISLVLAPLSGSSLYVAGGAVFGKEIGFLLSYLASVLGCSINFAISRQYGRQVASRFVGENHLRSLDQYTRKLRSHHAIFYLSLVMPIAQDLVSYAAGLTRIRYRSFLVALMISSVAIVAAYIYLGSSLLESVVRE